MKMNLMKKKHSYISNLDLSSIVIHCFIVIISPDILYSQDPIDACNVHGSRYDLNKEVMLENLNMGKHAGLYCCTYV
jgi:hypothetical protein